MKRFSSLLVVVSMILLVSQACAADDSAASGGKKVYKQVNPDGSVTYTDKPSPGAKTVEVPKTPTYKPPSVPQFSPYQEPAKPVAFSYDSVKITAPANEETIRDNAEAISVVVSVEPALRPGDQIVFLVDGTVKTRTTLSTYAITEMERGSHTITAQVVDAAGTVMGSDSVTVFFHKPSLLSPGRSSPGGPTPSPN